MNVIAMKLNTWYWIASSLSGSSHCCACCHSECPSILHIQSILAWHSAAQRGTILHSMHKPIIAGQCCCEQYCVKAPLLMMVLPDCADAKCFPALDFKVRRQEVSINDADSSHADSDVSDSHSSHADSGGMTVSANSHHSLTDKLQDLSDAEDANSVIGIDGMHPDGKTDASEPQEDCQAGDVSTLQSHLQTGVVSQSGSGDDTDMVSVYPEYLLHGEGLQLLQLCMAMWSPDPAARPTWGCILDRLNSIS